MSVYSREDDASPEVQMQIPLTQGQQALVHGSAYEWASQFKWHARWSANTRSYYAARKIATGQLNPRQRIMQMHNAIYEEFVGPVPEGFTVDHINRDSLNNDHVGNLRLATRTEQSQNRGTQTNNTSGFPGVYWHNGQHKWCAHIGVQGQQI